MKSIALALHGGSGTILRSRLGPEKEAAYRAALSEALEAGWAMLEAGASSLDVVEEVVVRLEDCPLFNAGRGSVYTAEGIHEMDAAIMSGDALRAGAIAGVRNLRNPIRLARRVMEKSDYVFLAGPGAEAFARQQKLPFEAASYFATNERWQQLVEAKKQGGVVMDHDTTDRKFGTVGAVALDTAGNLAAATSTGGLTNKSFGRVGDTPVIGAGTYADDATCAVSCTGYGEEFIRSAVAHDVASRMRYLGQSLDEATRAVVHETLPKIGGEGGLIAVDAKGNLALPFNTEGMYRAWRSLSGRAVEIYR